jgi:hypothetical protein
MNCIKCGKKTKGEQVFCNGCLEAMEAYPVKPDVHIQLPNHASPAAPKKAGKKRRNPTTEEQIAHLRRTVMWMAAVITILAALLATACIMLFPFAGGQETSSVGKNYTYDSNFD